MNPPDGRPLRGAAALEPQVDDDDPGLAVLKEKIQKESGFNSLFYKDRCLRRRIAVRMRACGLSSYVAYAQLLDRDRREYDRLIDTLTINVTKFFRNIETWQTLESEILPQLLAGPDESCEVWSAGCSSGEEPYSLSILFHEWAVRHGRAAELSRVRIDATDIDSQSLAAAQASLYPELSLAETPADLRERWFSGGPPYRLRAEAKSLVSFRRHDLISDPPLSSRKLILCRNVIIYLDREVQEKLFEDFYDALVPGGVLVLGRVETLMGRSRRLFRTLHPRERIFQKPP
jgi:chemotaxis protein methyltransferase CheR